MAKWINMYDEGYIKLDYRIAESERIIYLRQTEDGKENHVNLTIPEFDKLYQLSRNL